MADCIFCKIVAGTMSAEKVYEDEAVLAFLDLFPVTKGHTLVIPKEHVRTLTEASPELMQAIASRLSKIAQAVMKGTNAGGLNLGVNCEKIGGQHVFHLHFHLIPRHENDGLRTWPQMKYEEGELEKFATAIRLVLPKS